VLHALRLLSVQGTNAHAICTVAEEKGEGAPASGLSGSPGGQAAGSGAGGKEGAAMSPGKQSLMAWQRDRLWVHPR
jgi:hypothetical protein